MIGLKTLVIGAGGVGGYLAARLSRGGADVTVAARGEHGRAVAERGLTLTTSDGSEQVHFANVTTALDSLRERFSLILIAVKWPDLEAACDALPNLIATDGVAVPLLNGLSSEDFVATYVGAQRTLGGVAYMSAGLVAPGEVYANGSVKVGLAPYRPGQEPELARVAALLGEAHVATEVHDDYRAMLWQKMVWNAPFNALCALSQTNAGEAVARMEPLLRRAMLEVLAVAQAEGVALPTALIDGMLQLTRTEFPLTEPSMLQDVRRGRRTEVDILQGEVVRRAERLGVDVPVLFTLATLIRGLTDAPSAT